MAGVFFRAGVVAVVRRADARVLAFERAEPRGSWQLPQGGMVLGETPVEAVWRELDEETGLGPDEVRLVGEHDRWVVYEWPPERQDRDRLGQAQRWFFFEILDEATEPTPDGREFVDWTWMPVDELVDGVVEFRRAAYRQVLG